MKSAITRIDLRLLRDFLRFPKEANITGVREDPDNPHKCIIEIEGSWLPEGCDEVTAEYSYLLTTIPKFEKWVPVD